MDFRVVGVKYNFASVQVSVMPFMQMLNRVGPRTEPCAGDSMRKKMFNNVNSFFALVDGEFS